MGYRVKNAEIQSRENSMRFCPYCGGDLSPHLAAAGRAATAPASPKTQGEYDQVKIWKELLAEANATKATPPALMGLLDNELGPEGSFDGPFTSLVHLAFDREIVPLGGVLYKATLVEGRTAMDDKRLEAMGYAVRDGHVVTIDDVPVGKAYTIIDYWGGEKQHKRWHMERPVILEASRNGDPFFMDENMICFGAKWSDASQLEKALLELLELFITGFPSSRGLVAVPLAMRLRFQ